MKERSDYLFVRLEQTYHQKQFDSDNVLCKRDYREVFKVILTELISCRLPKFILFQIRDIHYRPFFKGYEDHHKSFREYRMDSLEMKIFIKSTYMDQAMKSLEYFIGKCFPNIKVKSQSSYLRKRDFNRKRFERRDPEYDTYKKRPKKYNDFDDDYENVRIKD